MFDLSKHEIPQAPALFKKIYNYIERIDFFLFFKRKYRLSFLRFGFQRSDFRYVVIGLNDLFSVLPKTSLLQFKFEFYFSCNVHFVGNLETRQFSLFRTIYYPTHLKNFKPPRSNRSCTFHVLSCTLHQKKKTFFYYDHWKTDAREKWKKVFQRKRTLLPWISTALLVTLQFVIRLVPMKVVRRIDEDFYRNFTLLLLCDYCYEIKNKKFSLVNTD
jgi:hypothetical protein